MKLYKKDVHIIDGMDSLLNCINPVDFVKLAVQSSFFFSPSIVMERHEEMKRILNNHEPLSVRRTARKDKSEKHSKTKMMDSVALLYMMPLAMMW